MGNLPISIPGYEPNGALQRIEMERLEKRMKRLGRGRAEVARSDLMSVEGGIGTNPFIDRLFRLYDHDKDGLLVVHDMIRLMQTFKQLGQEEEARYRFAFLVFDLNGDGYIDADELFQALKSTNTRKLHPDQLRKIVDSTLSRWDRDGHGKLDFTQFKELCASSSELVL